MGKYSLLAYALASIVPIASCDDVSRKTSSAKLVCLEHSEWYFGAYQLSAETMALPEQIVDKQADDMERVVAHNQRRSFGSETRTLQDGRWESHGVAEVTAKTSRLVSIRESWRVMSYQSYGDSMTGKIYDLASYQTLNTQTIMADPDAASRAIKSYGEELARAFRAGEMTLPITLNDSEAVGLRLGPKALHNGGWFVPSETNGEKIGGIAFSVRSGGAFDPYHYVFVVPQSIFRDYLKAEYLDQFEGQPVDPVISEWTVPSTLFAAVDSTGVPCDSPPE